MLQRVVFAVQIAVFNRFNFRMDGQHRVAKPIKFCLGFTLGRLNHQRPRHRPTHRRRVKAAIHKPLCDILNRHTGGLFEWPHVQHTFMCHAPRWPTVEHLKRPLQPLGDVIGVQDRDPCRLRQAVSAHHQAIRPADRQQRR